MLVGVIAELGVDLVLCLDVVGLLPRESAWCLAVSFCVDKYIYSLYFILVLALIDRAWAVCTLYCPAPAA